MGYFRYNLVKDVDRPLSSTGAVEGWKEKNLLESLLESGDRVFNVQAGEITVVIDIHFLESLMKAINLSGYLETGFTPSEGKYEGIEIPSVKTLIKFLNKHHDSSEIKLPIGYLDLLMLCISHAPRFYAHITTFEEESPGYVEGMRGMKIVHRENIVKGELEEFMDLRTNKMIAQIEKVEEYYGGIIEIAEKAGKEDVVSNIKNNVMAKKLEDIYDTYGEDVENKTKNTDELLERIPATTYVTYSFFMSEFDLLVAKIGDKKIKLRTIYDINHPQDPANCFLAILDYGDTPESIK